MRPNRIAAAFIVCCLLAACGKSQQPAPKQAEPAKPAPVENAAPAVKLNNAEPVVPTPPEGTAPLPLQTPPPIPVSREPAPPGASAAELQALREAFERQKQADQSTLEGLQNKLAALEQRLAQWEAKPPPRPQPAANPVKPTRKKAKTRKAHVASAKLKVLKTASQASADTAPALPFTVGSVDTWNGEKQVMVRSGGQWRGLKPGDSQDGWRIEAADGQAVTLRSPQGKRWQIEARQGG
ncbi:MAG: hypothetical protein ACKN9T_04000 [Candidatus Methylumidiphilus sp.]